MNGDALRGRRQGARVAGPGISPPEADVPGQFAVQRGDDQHGIVLALVGELDLGSAPALERELRAIEATAAGRILIDLRGLAFMDCTGIAILTRAQQSAHATGRRLLLQSCPGQVSRLFQLTGCVERFTFLD